MAYPSEDQLATIQYKDKDGNVLLVLDRFGSLQLPDPNPASGAKWCGVVCTAKLTVTAAQLKALKATPKTVIAAPGTGLAIVVLDVSYHYEFLTSAFTLNAGTLRLYYGPVANAAPLHADVAAGLIDQAANRNNIGVPAIATGNLTDANTTNQPILIANDGAAEYTVGLGSLNVFVRFTVIKPA